MRFLLINPATAGSRQPAYFPLGLAYVARVLLDDGHEVEILDINANRWSADEVAYRVRRADFDVAGITGMVTEFPSVRWLSGLIKKINPTATVVLGGGLPTAFPRLALEKTEADIAVVGEGEITIGELATALAARSPLTGLKGIWYKDGGCLGTTQPRELVDDLDTLQFPARHLFPLELYVQNPVPYLRMFDRNVVSTNIVSSRGCPYKCTYCFHGLWGDRFRARSAEDVINEIRVLHNEYGITGVFFMDDTFVLDRERLVAICDGLIGENLGIIWAASGRVNLVDRHVLEKMRAAGCRTILYGIESGSQKILDEMRKGVRVEQARQAIQETWQAGILPVGFLMIGMFSETRQTVEETVRFCNETGLVSSFSYATPFPGTELYAQAVEREKIEPRHAERLLERWGAWTDEILVNLTSMSDDDLKSIKRSAQRRILWGEWWRKVRLYIPTLGMGNAGRELFRFAKKALRIGEFT